MMAQETKINRPDPTRNATEYGRGQEASPPEIVVLPTLESRHPPLPEADPATQARPEPVHKSTEPPPVEDWTRAEVEVWLDAVFGGRIKPAQILPVFDRQELQGLVNVRAKELVGEAAALLKDPDDLAEKLRGLAPYFDIPESFFSQLSRLRPAWQAKKAAEVRAAREAAIQRLEKAMQDPHNPYRVGLRAFVEAQTSGRPPGQSPLSLLLSECARDRKVIVSPWPGDNPDVGD